MQKIVKLSLYIIIILLILKLVINIFQNIIYENDVIKTFHNNKIMFDSVISELDDIETAEVKKKFFGYQLTIDKFKNYKYVFNYKNEKYNEYRETFAVTNKLNVQSVSKYDNNIEFSFNSILEPGMEIVYIQDYEQYIWGHSIVKIKNIEGNWYYVKLN